MNQIPVRSVPNGPLALCGYPPVCNRGVTEPTLLTADHVFLNQTELEHQDTRTEQVTAGKVCADGGPPACHGELDGGSGSYATRLAYLPRARIGP